MLPINAEIPLHDDPEIVASVDDFEVIGHCLFLLDFRTIDLLSFIVILK